MPQKKKLSPELKELDLPSRIRNFNKRWNIISDNGENSQKFKYRILMIVDRVVGNYFLSNPKASNQYAFFLGHNLSPSAKTDGAFDPLILIGRKFEDDIVYKILVSTADFQEFITAIQTLFWVLEQYRCPYINELADDLQTAIDLSPSISLRIVRNDDKVTIYPGGAKILDEKLVNESLSWLENRPSVSKHYEQALNIYLSKDESKYRNLLDNLRLALEQLLRIILGNKKSLENQKTGLLSWLKNRAVHQQIINMYDDLLAKFTQYQNDAVKHGDNWSNVEIEFMIYLTGVFIRLLLELEKQP